MNNELIKLNINEWKTFKELKNCTEIEDLVKLYQLNRGEVKNKLQCQITQQICDR